MGLSYPVSYLVYMLTFCRRSGGPGETLFLKEILDRIPGIKQDAKGNRYLTIGEYPTTLFSSHFDSVHNSKLIRQRPHLRGNTLYKKDSSPLGADDATGMWIMFNLIAAKVEGLYIFHTMEEIGGHGSNYIAHQTPGLLTNIERAIAFDRKGTKSVITHQGDRCCSDIFALSLAEKLGMGYEPDPTGIFTDTANYTHIIPECTNISVGYYDEHTKRETQDLDHAVKLCHACLEIDWDSLPTIRDPNEQLDFMDYQYGYKYRDYKNSDNYYKDFDDILTIVSEYPCEVAQFLIELGYSTDELLDELELMDKPIAINQ